MDWNWQLDDWPHFRYEASCLAAKEPAFLKQGGMLAGAYRHLRPGDDNVMVAEVMTSEALTTSAIEGEILDRESVRSSILRHLGMKSDSRRVGPREEGISEMTIDLLRTALAPLEQDMLFRWHRALTRARTDLDQIGGYRTHTDPMQIVSGPIGRQTVHFEAPPSERVPREMSQFIRWFNGCEATTTPLARAGIAHLYFESIHPFEDGSGRIGRAISEKALSQGIGQAGLILLATEIESRQTDYYAQLEKASRSNEVTAWLEWFGEVVLAAQMRTQRWIDFLIAKSRLLEDLQDRINERQEKALLRVMREGPDGFEGGLSAGKYQVITGASPATAGRDLTALIELGALRKTGVGKGTRYWLDLH